MGAYRRPPRRHADERHPYLATAVLRASAQPRQLGESLPSCVALCLVCLSVAQCGSVWLCVSVFLADSRTRARTRLLALARGQRAEGEHSTELSPYRTLTGIPVRLRQGVTPRARARARLAAGADRWNGRLRSTKASCPCRLTQQSVGSAQFSATGGCHFRQLTCAGLPVLHCFPLPPSDSAPNVSV